jgi:hypothetical protein
LPEETVIFEANFIFGSAAVVRSFSLFNIRLLAHKGFADAYLKKPSIEW